MGTQRHISVISDSDLVPTHADRVANVTPTELARVLRSVDTTVCEVTLNGEVFAEDTIEMPAASAEPTLL